MEASICYPGDGGRLLSQLRGASNACFIPWVCSPTIPSGGNFKIRKMLGTEEGLKVIEESEAQL